jgi:hypothetical protein
MAHYLNFQLFNFFFKIFLMMLFCQTLLKNRTHPQEDRKEQKESIYTLVDMLWED